MIATHPAVPTAEEFLRLPERLQEHRGEPGAELRARRLLAFRERAARRQARSWRNLAWALWLKVKYCGRWRDEAEAIREYIARAHAWERLLRAYRPGRFPTPASAASGELPDCPVRPRTHEKHR